VSEGRQWIGDGLSGISTNGGGIGVAERVQDRRLTLLKRHEVQTLLAAGHDQIEVAVIAGVSVRSVRRIAAEPAVEHVADCQGRVQRRIGRPSKVEPFRALVQEQRVQVDEETHAPLKSVEILRRALLDGYRGGKSALYELIAELRPHATRLMMRFEGVPGEFSQDDFGEVRITYLDGSRQVVRFSSAHSVAPVARRGERRAPQPSHRRDSTAAPAAGIVTPATVAGESRPAGVAHTDPGVSDCRGELRRSQLRHAAGGCQHGRDAVPVPGSRPHRCRSLPSPASVLCRQGDGVAPAGASCRAVGGDLRQAWAPLPAA